MKTKKILEFAIIVRTSYLLISLLIGKILDERETTTTIYL